MAYAIKSMEFGADVKHDISNGLITSCVSALSPASTSIRLFLPSFQTIGLLFVFECA